jgi:hypothetical protein
VWKFVVAVEIGSRVEVLAIREDVNVVYRGELTPLICCSSRSLETCGPHGYIASDYRCLA